jgi:hypothetical protein
MEKTPAADGVTYGGDRGWRTRLVVPPCGRRRRCRHPLSPWRRLCRGIGARLSAFCGPDRGARQGAGLCRGLWTCAGATVSGGRRGCRGGLSRLAAPAFRASPSPAIPPAGDWPWSSRRGWRRPRATVRCLRPVAVAVMSPWTDLALTGDSIESRAKHDPLLSRDALEVARQLYLGQADAKDPRVSPLYGDLTGLPPSCFTSARTRSCSTTRAATPIGRRSPVRQPNCTSGRAWCTSSPPTSPAAGRARGARYRRRIPAAHLAR